MPRLTTEPQMHPQACLVTNRADGELIDFEAIAACVEKPYVYIRRDIVEQAARELCGMVDGADVAKLEAQVGELASDLAQTLERLQAIEGFKETLNEIENDTRLRMEAEVATIGRDETED